MYTKLPHLTIGFHGCSKETCTQILKEEQELIPSRNDYDWLGSGIYFWENNYDRASDWAEKRYEGDGAVIGAVIDLGNCLNLSDSRSEIILKKGHESLKARFKEKELPKNHGITKDKLKRELDCAVIQHIHEYNKDRKLSPFDSVRGVFIEGEPVYEGAEIYSKTHIQLCVINPNCIKGYFHPRIKNEKYINP